MAATRVEHDCLGQVNVPSDKLWGAQTQRFLEHFSSGQMSGSAAQTKGG